MSNIEPLKIFVKFIPASTTKDEIKTFFSVCGEVVRVHLVSPKTNYEGKTPYMYAFITYETQAGADRAILELNNKEMGGKKLSVVYSLITEARKEGHSSKDQEKQKAVASKEYKELWLTCHANAEKIKQMYNNPKEEKEITELRVKKDKLQAKQNELKKINDTLKEEINVLRLQVKIKKLETENTKLKESQ